MVIPPHGCCCFSSFYVRVALCVSLHLLHYQPSELWPAYMGFNLDWGIEALKEKSGYGGTLCLHGT